MAGLVAFLLTGILAVMGFAGVVFAGAVFAGAVLTGAVLAMAALETVIALCSQARSGLGAAAGIAQ
jgi:hypothetical protein